MAKRVEYYNLIADIPGKFHVMDEEEKIEHNFATDDRSILYYNDDIHTIVGFHSKKINKFVGFLADKKTLSKNNQKNMKRANPTTNISMEYEVEISGKKYYSFQIEYQAGDRDNIGEYLMIVHKGIYYAVTINYRAEFKEKGEFVWNNILNTIEIINEKN